MRDARVAALAANHDLERESFAYEQGRFARTLSLPETVPLGDHGTLIIRECALLGWSQKAYLRAKFTFVNTTGKRIKTPRVWLIIEDPVTGEEQASWIDLTLPLGLAFHSESSYSSWLDVGMKGLHRRDGWTWRMEVELLEKEPEKADRS